ncbi:MAG: gamma-glutamyltransferase, partial [Alphaproteobacteria bacterium]
KMEARFDGGLVGDLKAAGHEVEIIDPFSDLMGHAGAVSLGPDGIMEGASDPRADGKAAGI